VQDDPRRAFKQQGEAAGSGGTGLHPRTQGDDNRVIKPLYRLRDCLPDPSNEPQEEVDSLTAVRNLGPQVGAEGLEPPTPAL
jgi:hypothetical protein